MDCGGFSEERFSFGQDELLDRLIVHVPLDDTEGPDRCLLTLDGVGLEGAEDHRHHVRLDILLGRLR